MRRRTFNKLAAGSFTLAVVIGVLWILSNSLCAVSSSNGRILLATAWGDMGEDMAAWFHSPWPILQSALEGYEDFRFEAIGFELRAGKINHVNGSSSFFKFVVLAIPYWFLFGVALIIPAIWTLRRVQWLVRKRRGRCFRCGYDLRASANRCPECGAVAARR